MCHHVSMKPEKTEMRSGESVRFILFEPFITVRKESMIVIDISGRLQGFPAHLTDLTHEKSLRVQLVQTLRDKHLGQKID